MQIESLLGMGDFGTNAYIISDGSGAVLIDAPCDPDRILEKLGDRKLEAIFLTHGHVDHTQAAAMLKKRTGCEVYISDEDMPMLTSSGLSLADYFSMPFIPLETAHRISDGDVVSIAGLSIKVVATPGHTPGCLCFLIGDTLFTGDTLFKDSIGRDFGCDCYRYILDSIAKLYGIGEDCTVLCGHGEATSLYDELMFNPFLEPLRDRMLGGNKV